MDEEQIKAAILKMREEDKNVPPSWGRMTFFNRMCYLVDSHQAKSFKAARALLRAPPPPTQQKPAAARLPYKDN